MPLTGRSGEPMRPPGCWSMDVQGALRGWGQIAGCCLLGAPDAGRDSSHLSSSTNDKSVEHCLLRYGSYSVKNNDSLGGEQPL